MLNFKQKLKGIKKRYRELRDKRKNTPHFNGEPVKSVSMVWCMMCKRKIRVSNATVKDVRIKKGSTRSFLQGKCPQCNRKVSGLIKNKCVGGL